MSKILSGRTENRFGCGATKLGGGENAVDDEAEKSCLLSSLLLTEAEDRGVSDNSEEALIEALPSGTLWLENGRRVGTERKFRSPAMLSLDATTEIKKLGVLIGFTLHL